MRSSRKTAVVQFVLFSGATEGSLPLATEREFHVVLSVEGVNYPAQNFCSPINDEQWRQFNQRLSECNMAHDATGFRKAAAIRTLAHQLYESLVSVNPVLRDFLSQAGVPRRLVIQTQRPELHLLPWGALIDDTGAFLASGDLSVVQSWFDFDPMSVSTGEPPLQLKYYISDATQRVTQAAVDALPDVINKADGTDIFLGRVPTPGLDIINIEEHGNAVTNCVGAVAAAEFAKTFAGVKIGLLWSCCSGAANSWGESPALCLHREKAIMVVSFLVELHNLDATSISRDFYREVFGPAASRDPESALVHIRAARFANEFQFGNWASMTVHMSAPLDLSSLPLNGPRVPSSSWTAPPVALPPDPSECDPTATPSVAQPTAAASTTVVPPDPAEPLWTALESAVSQLQAGTLNEFHGFEKLDASVTHVLPRSAFKAWRGNVIHFDGFVEPLAPAILTELNVAKDTLPATDAAERLVWFFGQIERYGSPLIVWTNAAARHLAFLRTIETSSSLTFLLIYGPEPPQTLLGFVNQDDLHSAQLACEQLDAESAAAKQAWDQLDDAQKAATPFQDPWTDDLLSAAYWAYARSEDTTKAVSYLKRVTNEAELWLLVANYISRRGMIPDPKPDWMLHHPDGKLTTLQQQHCQEDCFRRVMSSPGTDAPLRESGRAKHQLGYLLQSLGKTSVAELIYGQALADLEKCPAEKHDYRWHLALGCLLRDWASLLADSPERLEAASALLDRAMAIHSFHGRRLQIAYCLDTAARISLTAGQFSSAVDNAVDSANLFEVLNNWRGWGEAMKILFDCLAQTRETERMKNLSDLAMEKLRGSNLPEDQRNRLRRMFIYEKANAHWIGGDFEAARAELARLGLGTGKSDVEIDPAFETEIRRLFKFLSLPAPNGGPLCPTPSPAPQKTPKKNPPLHSKTLRGDSSAMPSSSPGT